MRRISAILIVPIFLLSALSAEETKYTNYSFARLSYVTENTYIQRAADLGYEEAVVNTPIAEGDRLGTTEGRAEIYLGKSNYVRLDHNTKVDFLNLPKRGYDLVRIRIWSGNVYFSVDFLEKEKNIEIHTSDVSVYVLSEGLYRIDVREGAETDIFVFHGLVEASGQTGSVLVKEEQKLEALEGNLRSRPTRFYAVAEDSFDRWSEYRDSQIEKRVAQQHLPEELEDFEYELSAYGDWIYIRPYGWVWAPNGVSSSWRPYYYGRWTWLPACGWTWIPYEPWGWCASHYGRWHWNVGLGWYWIPTTYWGPAWVSWYGGYDYFGWAPMSYYGYPGVIINNVYYGRYRDAYYPYDSRVLTVIHKNQLKARNVSKVALSQESIKKLGKISLSNKPLSIKTARNKVSVEKLEGKKLLLRKVDTPSEVEHKKRLSQSSIRKSASKDSEKAEKGVTRSSKPPQEKRIIKQKSEKESQIKGKKSSQKSTRYIKKDTYGYPSSPNISLKKYSNKSKTSKKNSFLGKVYNYISGSKKYIKSGSSRSSSRGSSSKGVKSRSVSRSSSASSRSSSSSSRSSRSSSSSGKVKKKK